MQMQSWKKSQSLPRLKKTDFQIKSQSLAKLFQHQAEITPKTAQQNTQIYQTPDPQQKHREQLNKILFKSKSMIQKNKDKIQVAKRFRISKKKTSSPFLTGVDIYKEQQEESNNKRYEETTKPNNDPNEQQNLKELLSEKYDDLSELRKMIRKTSKNLGAYKQQTMSIKKSIIFMADKFDATPINLIGRNKLFQKYELSYQKRIGHFLKLINLDF